MNYVTSGIYITCLFTWLFTCWKVFWVFLSALEPTFDKFPLRTSLEAALSGNVTYVCEPEAAPFPEFAWSKNGANLGLVAGDTSGRIRLLRNGNLLITQVQSSDAGKYRCTATNQAGSGYSEGTLIVTSKKNITHLQKISNVANQELVFSFSWPSMNRSLLFANVYSIL